MLRGIDGSKESWQQLNDFLSLSSELEIQAFFSARALPGAVRVLVVRHAMGCHNTFSGMGSLVSEDASLTDCGKAQADIIGDLLREAGVTSSLCLAVISPFTRTLQTALRLLGPAIGGPSEDPEREARAQRFGYSATPKGEATSSREGQGELLPTLVQPLCAEQTFVHSHLGRGNRGSTTAELAQRPEFAMFDWGEVESYCLERRVAARDPVQAGKWWHHGPHSEETESSFKRRVMRLRKWLGGLSEDAKLRNVLLVTHGGVMLEGFSYRPNSPNCGFRVFDIMPDGAAFHIAAGEWLPAPFLADPAFEVLAVVRRSARVDGHHLYDLDFSVGHQTCSHSARESELRECVHDRVREALGPELQQSLELDGKFPGWMSINRARSDPSIYIQDYLEQLALAIGDSAFPEDAAHQVADYLFSGALQEQRRSAAVEGGIAAVEVGIEPDFEPTSTEESALEEEPPSIEEVQPSPRPLGACAVS